jgi:hypothetical protein
MTISFPDDEITGSEDIISVKDVKERIGCLRPFRLEFDNGDFPASGFAFYLEAKEWIINHPVIVIEDGDESDELEALQALLPDLEGVSDDSYLVNDDYLIEWVQDENELSEDSPLFMFVNWEAVANTYKSDMNYVGFRGSTYWVRAR